MPIECIQRHGLLGAMGNRQLTFLARRMRPRRCASWRRDPAWLEIWISTLASGMSMELSPTLDRNTVLICSQRR